MTIFWLILDPSRMWQLVILICPVPHLSKNCPKSYRHLLSRDTLVDPLPPPCDVWCPLIIFSRLFQILLREVPNPLRSRHRGSTFGDNFINILRTKFLYKCHFGSIFYVHVTSEKLPKQHSYKNLYVKCWWNWRQLLVGKNDRRVSPTQSLELYHSMKALEKEVDMVSISLHQTFYCFKKMDCVMLGPGRDIEAKKLTPKCKLALTD